ncbi:methyltransferase domain-containing protein [Sphingobacterium spiritivorum]|uniref:Methyltransferase domain protein n=1 Tax=Sphingobacterium spiritivorum ATCC 33861 TaxID=525373 RepID=D7VQY0_SPHSI|nr:methyltransferase domain-containing protein [Sphingobacterium spiritivorum]EFK56181.1 methyltransferase domain protein [Sphingobacterium spiritivorum ATCC 33861]QQT35712.1 methyltransferase domain-containing protein [Sphingobacterium spiritivorum]WQD32425.1 methyltransferase domain-containing protein [Sphingobacterium spiritivorum]SUJ09284.1 ubiquinone/menaquinone biosynthesis methyltransferase [Sphingobacterium spiritivorum]
MAIKRKSFTGVWNIIRFNWHFYVIAALILIVSLFLYPYLPHDFQFILITVTIIAGISIISSLIVSCYIYDLSDLYKLKWLGNTDHKQVLNINAGFDETSIILKSISPDIHLTICDFYDPQKHTEISIKRARKIYPAKDAVCVQTTRLPFEDNTFDLCLAIFSVHEIRQEDERISFFRELNRITKSGGQIMITEHLRDIPNFLAYTIGFLHFYGKKNWIHIFREAGFRLKEEIKVTPFVSTFILEKNGITA